MGSSNSIEATDRGAQRPALSAKALATILKDEISYDFDKVDVRSDSSTAYTHGSECTERNLLSAKLRASEQRYEIAAAELEQLKEQLQALSAILKDETPYYFEKIDARSESSTSIESITEGEDSDGFEAAAPGEDSDAVEREALDWDPQVWLQPPREELVQPSRDEYPDVEGAGRTWMASMARVLGGSINLNSSFGSGMHHEEPWPRSLSARAF